MAFLGVDQSLTATGLCLLSSQAEIVALSTVNAGSVIGGQRLVVIKNALVAMCHSVDWKIAGAAIEGYSIGSINRPFDLGEIGGVVRMVLAERGILYSIVPPVLVKKFATGTTGADKDRMVKAAVALGATPDNDNEADALFLAKFALVLAGYATTRRCEMEAVHDFQHPHRRAPKRRLRKLVQAAI